MRKKGCDPATLYAGKPLFSGSVQLPSVDLALGTAFDRATSDRLDAALAKALAATHAPAIGAAVASRAGRWNATVSTGQQPAAQRFYWASVGKSFTAVVMLQLVQDGKLTLATTIERWFPKFPNARLITIDQLLTHTAGIYSYNEDERRRASPRDYPPKENIALAAKRGPLFCPGEYWRYSNTGYAMLGQIVEAIEGKPYHEVVQARIIARLGLKTVESLAPTTSPADVAPLLPSDGAPPVHAPSWAYAAGNIVGSPDEMLRYWQALLTGTLLPVDSTRRMFERLYPMFDGPTYYGRGVMLYEVPNGAETQRWLGHSGGTPGAKAVGS